MRPPVPGRPISGTGPIWPPIHCSTGPVAALGLSSTLSWRDTMSPKTAHQILDDPEFLKLVRQKNAVTVILTIVELVLYFGFIALIAYNKPFLAEKISEGSS